MQNVSPQGLNGDSGAGEKPSTRMKQKQRGTVTIASLFPLDKLFTYYHI